MHVFQAIGLTLNSIVSVVTTTARTADKTISLVELEVDQISAEQSLRLATTRSEAATLIHQEPQKKAK